MAVPEVKCLKSVEEDNARFKKLLAEAMLDKEALQVAPWRKHCQEFRLLLCRFRAWYCGFGEAEIADNLSADWANCCSDFFVPSSSPSPAFHPDYLPAARFHVLAPHQYGITQVWQRCGLHRNSQRQEASLCLTQRISSRIPCQETQPAQPLKVNSHAVARRL